MARAGLNGLSRHDWSSRLRHRSRQHRRNRASGLARRGFSGYRWGFAPFVDFGCQWGEAESSACGCRHRASLYADDGDLLDKARPEAVILGGANNKAAFFPSIEVRPPGLLEKRIAPTVAVATLESWRRAW
jgi:hypothetical protein